MTSWNNTKRTDPTRHWSRARRLLAGKKTYIISTFISLDGIYEMSLVIVLTGMAIASFYAGVARCLN